MQEKQINSLAMRIKDDVFVPSNRYKTTVFLCGADYNDKTSIRGRLARQFSSFWNSYSYDFVYPEDIFEEMMYGYHSQDLLSLENMLAKSVDAIVIIPESSGSIAELGAFANDSALREKIICVQDAKYRRKKSFINYGPIKLVSKSKTGKVLYINPLKMREAAYNVRREINKLKKTSSKIPSFLSLIQLDNYLLSAIFLMGPVPKGTLVQMVSKVSGQKEGALLKTTTALTMLSKKGYVSVTTSGYDLTVLGVSSFRNILASGKAKYSVGIAKLDKLRIDILNSKYRNKKIIA